MILYVVEKLCGSCINILASVLSCTKKIESCVYNYSALRGSYMWLLSVLSFTCTIMSTEIKLMLKNAVKMSLLCSVFQHFQARWKSDSPKLKAMIFIQWKVVSCNFLYLFKYIVHLDVALEEMFWKHSNVCFLFAFCHKFRK